MREALRRILGGLGRTSMTIGILILLFVAYQLWGTGYFTAREQNRLKHAFERRSAQLESTTTTPPPSTTSTTSIASTTPTTKPPSSNVVGDAKIPTINEGDPIGEIHLPWSTYAIVQGTTRDDLKKGPGHYLSTPYPGQLGNAAVAGHRTTYLHPFGDLDTLHKGMTFTVDMLWGHYTYRVVTEPFAVKPSDTYVVQTTNTSPTVPRDQPHGRDNKHAWLTLSTCHPKFSASHRLIVQAELVVAKSAPPKIYVAPPPVKPKPGDKLPDAGDALSQGLDGDPASRGPALVWGISVLMVGLAWWVFYRHWRHPLTWFAGLVPFIPVLFVFYVYLERLLPSGY